MRIEKDKKIIFNVKKVMSTFQQLEETKKEVLRTDLPLIEVGDTIEVITKQESLSSQRSLLFKGVVISQKNPHQPSHSFTVLKEESKIIYTSVFLYNSPSLISIKKLGKNRVRRAKLYYLERALSKKKA